MHIPLSKRLQACCSFVQNGDRVADVGCDHGYLSIYLLTNGIANSVIASDINEQPLQSAINNAEKYGVREKIKFFLSDGVRNIPRDFDTLVCAGMGADTMISILDSAPWLKDKQYRLILQCQSKSHMLRKYLSENGYAIRRETVLRDGRFLYTVMEIIYYPEESKLTLGQQYFSPALLADTNMETREYFDRLLFSLERAINGRGENADPEMVAALNELNLLKEKSI